MHQVISVTGHRPDKLGGYGNTLQEEHIQKIFGAWCQFHQPSLVITGMALGFDTHVAAVCLATGVPYVAAVPFGWQERLWPEKSQAYYRHLLSHAADVYYVSKGGYSQAAMHARNHWMVDNSDLTVALWNGFPGGTGECLAYAEKMGQPIVNLWDKFIC